MAFSMLLIIHLCFPMQILNITVFTISNLKKSLWETLVINFLSLWVRREILGTGTLKWNLYKVSKNALFNSIDKEDLFFQLIRLWIDKKSWRSCNIKTSMNFVHCKAKSHNLTLMKIGNRRTYLLRFRSRLQFILGMMK